MASARWWSKDTVAVVTGSNKGIGYEIVKQLASEGLTVVLTARNEQNGVAATEKLKKEGLLVSFHQLDVSSMESISHLASWLKQQYGGLDILINNAAITDHHQPSYAMALKVMETNYHGVKAITKELLPLLKASTEGARIINVSSGLGKLEKLTNPLLREEIGKLENLTEDKVDKFVEKYLEVVKSGKIEGAGYPFGAYSVSKIVLNAYTRVLARSLQNCPNGQHVYVNCMTPGYCKTDMTRNSGTFSAEQGAETATWLALLPPGGPTGQFFFQKNVISF